MKRRQRRRVRGKLDDIHTHAEREIEPEFDRVRDAGRGVPFPDEISVAHFHASLPSGVRPTLWRVIVRYVRVAAPQECPLAAQPQGHLEILALRVSAEVEREAVALEGFAAIGHRTARNNLHPARSCESRYVRDRNGYAAVQI